jgi:hypothetical protein
VQSFTFSKIAGGDTIYYGGGPCTVIFPYNVGRIFISGRGLSEIRSQKVTSDHVESRVGPGSGPQPPGRTPLLSRVVSSGQEYIVSPLHPSAISPYADKTESNGTHTRARSVSPGPPWPTRVCSQPIRDGRGGFAATLAHCAQLASGCHVTPAPVLRAGAGAGLARPTRRPRAPFCLFFAPPRSRPSRRGPRRPRPPTGPAAPPPRDSPAGRPPPRGRPPARESAALAGGASSGAAEPTVAPSRGPCSGPRRHARTPHAHRLPCSPLRLSGRLPGRARFASTQTLRRPSGARMSCNPSLSQKPPGGTRFTMAVVRARSFPHTTWAAFYLRTGT